MTQPTPQASTRPRRLTPTILLTILIIAGAAGAGVACHSGGSGPVAAPEAPAAQPRAHVLEGPALPVAPTTIERLQVDIEGAPFIGRPDAPVTVVEFIDYECPFCQRAHQTVEQVARTYSETVRLVYLQFPLDMHRNAPLASQAALAAAEQGRFRDMHDLLLRNRTKLARPFLSEYAGQLGLDVPAFEEALDSGRFATQVSNNAALGKELGVSGTPFFFVNGRPLRGVQAYEDFARIIDQELAGGLPETRWITRIPRDPPRQKRQVDNRIYRIDTSDSISIGPPSAPVTLVEFTDFQCPFCAQGQETLMQVVESYPNAVRVVVKNLPLSFHKDAGPAAIAALAANRQGKYWEYRSKLFSNQRALTRENLRSLASETGLDLERFDADIRDPELASVLERDLRQAAAIGVSSTPTFLVNGRKVVGAQSLEEFRQIIEVMLAASGAAAS